MALYPTKPLFSPSATATNGSDIIQVTGNVNCSFLMAGAIVSIAGANRLADAISGTGVVGGNSTIKLARPWAGATVTGQMIVFMSYEGLADAVFQLKSIIDQAAASADIGIGYLGNYDLAAAGALPPAPADGTGSRMYRISTAATVASVAYRAGEVIYFDQYLNVWRRMDEALGSGAYASVVASVGDLTAGRLLTVGATKAQLADDVYGRSNILGTVSQTAGVPTGAIIQRGSNANGQFTRYADGTAEYWGTRTVTGVTINPASNGNSNTSFAPADPLTLDLTDKVFSVVRANGFAADGTEVYLIRAEPIQQFLNLGTRPADQFPFLNQIGTRVITSYTYAFRAVGRWF
jgi:hypothetical protein